MYILSYENTVAFLWNRPSFQNIKNRLITEIREPWMSMMMSSNGNVFHATGPLCRGFTGHQWIPLTKASDVELWYFLWSEHNCGAGDLRCHHAHYDVIVMLFADLCSDASYLDNGRPYLYDGNPYTCNGSVCIDTGPYFTDDFWQLTLHHASASM